MPATATTIPARKSVKPPPLRIIESGKRTQTVKRCEACDGINRSMFDNCDTCRSWWALTQRTWRAAQAKQGKCQHCVAKAWKLGGHTYLDCKAHRLYSRALHKRIYDARRAAGQCVWCKEPTDKVYCEHHLEIANAYSRKSRRSKSKRTYKRAA